MRELLETLAIEGEVKNDATENSRVRVAPEPPSLYRLHLMQNEIPPVLVNNCESRWIVPSA